VKKKESGFSVILKIAAIIIKQKYKTN